MKLLVFICLATLAFGAAIVEDDCNKVAVADVKTKCEKTATAAGASTACCLATFASPPTTPKQADNNALAAVVDPNKGGDVNADGKFYSCYKSGGVFRFKTHGDATTANKNAESWIAASVFCTAG